MTMKPEDTRERLQYSDSEQVLADLIARLEKATGPDRGIDAAIAKICDPADDPSEAAFFNGRDYPDQYTSSIDAALTLVPDGWDWRIGGPDWRHEVRASYFGYVREYREDMAGRPDSEGSAHHTAPAIALCIAALTARSSSTEERTTGTGSKVP